MLFADVTVGVPDVNAWVIGLAAFVVAWGVIWRGVVRPLVRKVRGAARYYGAAVAIIHRELTPNGGTSVKDASTRGVAAITEAAAAARDAAAAAAALSEQVAEVHGSQETIFQLWDDVVKRKGQEHAEIWRALADLGFDRRRTDPTKEQP